MAMDGCFAYDGVVGEPGVCDDEVLLDPLERGGQVDPLPDVPPPVLARPPLRLRCGRRRLLHRRCRRRRLPCCPRGTLLPFLQPAQQERSRTMSVCDTATELHAWRL
jgi:hypothetical protein